MNNNINNSSDPSNKDFEKAKQFVNSFFDKLENAKDKLEYVADAVAEKEFQETFLQEVTLKDCLQFFKDEKAKINSTDIGGFVVSVKQNPDKKNENDCFIVIEGLIDRYKKPFTVNGQTVSRKLHTKTIDDALIQQLNGKESVMFLL